jgi:UDP-GlcNAc3NAcA epimerase
VSQALAATDGASEILIHTGQHFDADMSDVFFDELGIAKPDYNLDIHGGGHGAMTGSMLQKLEPLLEQLRPDRVLIYGDTNSTLAGALVAAKMHIPVAHVEAGLRSFNKAMPEEINRIVADHLSEMLFTSTTAATNNLKNEGVATDLIVQAGDVMYDAALLFAEKAAERNDLLATIGVAPKNYVLATVHRAENTDDPDRLRNIVASLDAVAATLPVILPLHPRTAKKMQDLGLSFGKVKIIPPAGYLDMVALESNASLIATDSGGVQKEAFFYKVPCVTLRDETEWMELIELGWNRLASPSEAKLAERVLAALGTEGLDAQPYGDGRASRIIAKTLTG